MHVQRENAHAAPSSVHLHLLQALTKALGLGAGLLQAAGEDTPCWEPHSPIPGDHLFSACLAKRSGAPTAPPLWLPLVLGGCEWWGRDSFPD